MPHLVSSFLKNDALLVYSNKHQSLTWQHPTTSNADRNHHDGSWSFLDDLCLASTIRSQVNSPSEKDKVGDNIHKAIWLVNMFLTGKAGTGKSWAKKCIMRDLCDSDRNKLIFANAPTGIAAINITERAIDSWWGLMLSSIVRCSFEWKYMLCVSTSSYFLHTNSHIAVLSENYFTCICISYFLHTHSHAYAFSYQQMVTSWAKCQKKKDRKYGEQLPF